MRCPVALSSASLALVLLVASSMVRADDHAAAPGARHKSEGAAPKLPPPRQVTVDVGHFRLGQAKEQAELGRLWSRVVEAALGTLQSLVELQRIAAAREALRPARATPAPRLSWQRDLGAPLRKEPARPQKLRPTPVAADASIVSEAREQHAILLGAEMQLPWQVP